MPSNLNQIVTHKTLTQWLSKLGMIPRCETCGEEFRIGDHIEVKYNKVAKRQHKRLWYP